MADRLAHAPHLRLRPSLTHDLDERARADRSPPARPHLRRRVGPSSSSTPSRKRRSSPGVGHALDLGEVLLLHTVARMREQLREVAVVGEHQQALGVVVEPADREHARLARHEVEHGAAALRIARGRHVARPACSAGSTRASCRRRRARRRPSTRAVAGSTRAPSTATSPSTVTRPVGDQLLARAARPEAGAREHLLQALAVSSCSTGRARRSGRSALRLGFGLGRSSASASTSPATRRPRSSASTIDASGTKSPSAGSSVERVEAEPLEERARGAEQRRVARRRVVADLLDVAALHERLQRRVDVDAADRRELRPRDRLLVGDDRERLERRARQPRGLAFEHEPLDVRRTRRDGSGSGSRPRRAPAGTRAPRARTRPRARRRAPRPRRSAARRAARAPSGGTGSVAASTTASIARARLRRRPPCRSLTPAPRLGSVDRRSARRRSTARRPTSSSDARSSVDAFAGGAAGAR